MSVLTDISEMKDELSRVFEVILSTISAKVIIIIICSRRPN